MLAALRRLPLQSQMLLELYYWEDLTGPELAQTLELSHNTVRSRLSRAREALRLEVHALCANPQLAESTLRRLENAEREGGWRLPSG